MASKRATKKNMDIPELNISDELLDFDLNVEIPGFELDLADMSAAIQTDFVKIRRYPRVAPSGVLYEKAVDLVKKMPDIQENEAFFCIVSGNFIFGDLLEALLVERNWYAEEIFIATLSMSQENADSLANLFHGDYAREINLIVSDFWYAHERYKGGGIEYINQLMEGFNFSLSVAGLHTKIILIKTECGKHLVLHGSANLRSSRNLEQLSAENSKDLYEFNRTWMSKLVAQFKVSRKSLRGDNIWQVLQEQQAE